MLQQYLRQPQPNTGGFGARQSPYASRPRDFASPGLQRTRQALDGRINMPRRSYNPLARQQAQRQQVFSQRMGNTNFRVSKPATPRTARFTPRRGMFSPQTRARAERVFSNASDLRRF